jgi:YVTN family beta-propeller protein
MIYRAIFFVMFVTAALVAASATQPRKQALLVLNKSDNTLAIVDPDALRLIGQVPTGEGPHEVATSSDGKLAFVANYGTAQRPGNTISVIDLESRKEVRRIDLSPLGRPHGITEAGGKIYFTVEANRAVARYDPASNKIDWIMGTGQNGTHMVVVAPDLKRLYTANIGSNTVTSITLGGQPGIEHISVGRGPEGIDISPDGRQLWVAHRNDGGLSIIEAATNKVAAQLRVGRMPIRVKFTPDGKRVLVTDAMTGELIVIDAAAREEIKRIQVGEAPVGVLIAPDNKRAFVASTRGNKVVIVNLESLEVVGSLQTGREPDGMAWARGI